MGFKKISPEDEKLEAALRRNRAATESLIRPVNDGKVDIVVIRHQKTATIRPAHA